MKKFVNHVIVPGWIDYADDVIQFVDVEAE